MTPWAAVLAAAVWAPDPLERRALAVIDQVRAGPVVFMRLDGSPQAEVWVRKDGSVRLRLGLGQALYVHRGNLTNAAYNAESMRWTRRSMGIPPPAAFLSSLLALGDDRVRFYAGPPPRKKPQFSVGGPFGEPMQGAETLHFDLRSGVPYKYVHECWGVTGPDEPATSEISRDFITKFSLSSKVPADWFDPNSQP